MLHTRSPIALYGNLRQVFRSTVGWKLLKAALWPDSISWHTLAVWAASIVWLAFPATSFFIDPQRGALFILACGAYGVCVYTPIANLSIRREYRLTYERYAISHQPMSTRRLLLHYGLFIDGLKALSQKPTPEEVRAALAYHETLRPALPLGQYLGSPIIPLLIDGFTGLTTQVAGEALKGIPKASHLLIGIGLALLVYFLPMALSQCHRTVDGASSDSCVGISLRQKASTTASHHPPRNEHPS